MSNKVAHRTKTRFGPVWINRHQDILQLKFDRLAIQSEINAVEPHQLRMKNLQLLMGLLLFMDAPKSVLLLGVGGGSLIQFMRHYFPDTHITGVEYDEELLQFVQKHLLLPQPDDSLKYEISDARDYIAHCNQQFDLIIVDIFNGDQTPEWLIQNDTSKRLKRLLSKRGALGFNLLIENEKVFTRFYQQLRNQFARQTLVIESEDYENLLIYALNFSAPKKSIAEQMQHAQLLQEQYPLPFMQTLSMIYAMNSSDSEIIY